MKANKLFLTCIFFVCACTPKQNATQNNSIKMEDGLKCEVSRFDFGDVSLKSKSTINFVFKIENTKSIKIGITSVDVGCECVHIKSYPKYIKSNVTEKIVGYIDLRKQYGHISKPIFVNTANKKVLLLRVVGNVTAH